MTLRGVYGMWPQYARRLREVVAAMSDDELAVRPVDGRWPVWATVGHMAGGRVYWLCDIVGEPGAETTPFGADAELGWEDDLDHARGAPELAEALDSTWRLIERCLDTWTIESLDDVIERDYEGRAQRLSRGSIMQRLLTHEAYHCGELSQTLGIHDLPQIDLWASE